MRNAMATCEIKLLQNYFRRRPTEIILFQRIETCVHLGLFQNYLRSLLQPMNIFQHVQCRLNVFEIISVVEILLFFSFRRDYV